MNERQSTSVLIAIRVQGAEYSAPEDSFAYYEKPPAFILYFFNFKIGHYFVDNQSLKKGIFKGCYHRKGGEFVNYNVTFGTDP